MKPTAEMVARLKKLSEKELAELCQDLARKTTALSQELTGYLGRPVNIKLTSNGLGYTWLDKEGPSVTININPRPILEGDPDGPTIFRGLGWHETGHQKLHTNLTASDKLMRLLKEDPQTFMTVDNLLDEHMERNIRSEREDIGQVFDKLVRYCWSEMPEPLTNQREFEYRNRTHRLQTDNPAVAKALKMIPKNFKNLTEWQIFDLAQEIAKFLKEEEEKQSSQDQEEQGQQQQPQGQSQQQGQQAQGKGTESKPQQAGTEGQDGESTEESEQLYGQVVDINDLPEELRNALLETLKQALEKAAKEVAEAHRKQSQQEEDETGTPGGQGLNLDRELDFDLIRKVVVVKKDIPEHQRILSRVRGDVRLLRKFFENLGFTYVDVYDQTDGYDLVSDIDRLAVFGDEDVFVDETLVSKASYDIQIIIDCSGSMAGDKMERAKTFGAITAEALRGIHGISCHFWGFTHTTIFDCGNAISCGASSLRAGGGNNDAAALWHASQRSAVSGKEIKILLMVSDGSPTECSWESLRGLVSKLTKQGFVCVQVAVDRIYEPAFDYFVDLAGYDFRTAVRQFGKLVQKLVRTTGERAGIL